MTMNKLTKLKEAMANPPAQRLAKIEYQSHLMQGLGIIAVCTLLIIKGFWYIIFAFIFGVGISYAQGMTAYRKYKAIKEFSDEEDPKDFVKDISYTRRRSKIISYVFGGWAKWVSIILAVLISFLWINPFWSRWILILIYPLSILAGFILCYYYISYWIAYPIYKMKLKGGKKNGKEKTRR